MYSLETLKRLNAEAEAKEASKAERVRAAIVSVLADYLGARVKDSPLEKDLLEAVLKVK